MTHAECLRFLDETLPALGLRPAGYRRLARRACKRIARRARALGVDLASYRRLLDDADERATLDALLRMPISRFLRDRPVFDVLGKDVLPTLAREVARRGDTRLRVWSLGCASGEEPYSVNLVWQLAVQPRCPGVSLDLLATDADAGLLARARAGTYPNGSLREVPAEWRALAFARHGATWLIAPFLREGVTFLQQDVRRALPDGPFDLILCRNVVFTYLDDADQRRILDALHERLRPGGALVLGRGERLPDPASFTAWPQRPELLLRGSSAIPSSRVARRPRETGSMECGPRCPPAAEPR